MLHDALRSHGEGYGGSWMSWMVACLVKENSLVEEMRVTDVMPLGRVDGREVWVSWRWSVYRAVVAILCSARCGLVRG